jgi:hypothetical protein
MRFNLYSVSTALALAHTTSAALVAERATSSASAAAATTTRKADAECSNTAFTRQCWGGGFSIATDYDTAWPNNGKTVYVR